MKLLYAELAGFRGFRELARFDFAPGFNVLSGRNGTGKSTILDAIDFALTGSINKFSVTSAKGGGLSDHIWWIGDGDASEHRVTIGFVADDGESFSVSRSLENGCDRTPDEITRHLCRDGSCSKPNIDNLVASTLIRDELISTLSLDLPGQQRFSAVRAAIGALNGEEMNKRTTDILAATKSILEQELKRLNTLKDHLGRELNALTEARSEAARSTDVAEAMSTIDAIVPAEASTTREEGVRRYVVARRTALGALAASIEDAARLQGATGTFDYESLRRELVNAAATLAAVRTELAQAQSVADAARTALQAETRADSVITHFSQLLEHGHALGLQDGRCPLCAAARSQEQFDRAAESIKQQIAVGEERIANAKRALDSADLVVAEKQATEHAAIDLVRSLESRRQELDAALRRLEDAGRVLSFSFATTSVDAARDALVNGNHSLVTIENALAVLEASRAAERVSVLEQKVAQIRVEQGDAERKVAEAERAVDAARHIENAAKNVANDILKEQFETVMPLLKELYRRLRPHSDWTEIDSDFGGRVRASLNFSVGDGHNPQFLFSSGQRRAAGLAFLLAVHMSRPWCAWRSLLLDDPVQHVDDYRALNLVEVLGAIRHSGRQIIVAVEDVALAELLCRRLRSSPTEWGRHFRLSPTDSGTAASLEPIDIPPMIPNVLRQVS